MRQGSGVFRIGVREHLMSLRTRDYTDSFVKCSLSLDLCIRVQASSIAAPEKMVEQLDDEATLRKQKESASRVDKWTEDGYKTLKKSV